MEYKKENDIRIKTGLLKYINLLRNAKQNNKTLGAEEMIIHARQARQPIHVITKPTPQLTPQDKHCYNSTKPGEIYADEAYKMNPVRTIHKDFIKHSAMATKDFDANRYQNNEDYNKGLTTRERLAQLLNLSGPGITEGPTIKTFGPEGRQASSWYYGWTWAKEFGRIC